MECYLVLPRLCCNIFLEVYLPELEKYQIWIYAIDNEEDYDENQDESWLKPMMIFGSDCSRISCLIRFIAHKITIFCRRFCIADYPFHYLVLFSLTY